MRAVSVILYRAQMSTSGAGRHPDESGRAHGTHPAPNPKTPRPAAAGWEAVDWRLVAGDVGYKSRGWEAALQKGFMIFKIGFIWVHDSDRAWFFLKA